MKIAIPARGLAVQTGGVKEFIKNLILHLPAIDPHNDYYIYYSDKREVLGVRQKNLHEVVLPGNAKLTWDHVVLPMRLRKDRIDLVIYPKCALPLLNPTRSIVCVYDFSYFFPGLEGYTWTDTAYMQTIIPWSIKRADAVLAISNHTKMDIHRFIRRVPDNKVKVVYLAPCVSEGTSDSSSLRTRHGLGDKPFLFISTVVSPRKNLERTLLAFASIKDQIPHNLVITGARSWGTSNIPKIIKQHGMEDRFMQLGYVEYGDLAALYRTASLYIMPSLYEGFSLTLVEAMKFGCPVVASNVACHPEIVEDAGVLFDPYSVEDIADAILKVIEDRELADRLRRAGYVQSAKFSWDRCAVDTLKLINQVFDESSS